VAGSDYAARREALRYGTPLNCELFTLQSKLLRVAAKAFLGSPQCENSSEALPAYLRGVGKGGGGWFFEEALWNAMYGVNSHVRRNAAAEAGRQRRQQQQEEARRQREQARRQRYEQARQQHRQQQFQRARYQQCSEAPADLAAAVPDVNNMSEGQLEAFLRTVSISGQPCYMLALLLKALVLLGLQLMHPKCCGHTNIRGSSAYSTVTGRGPGMTTLKTASPRLHST
jgi:hypothetical protein